MHAPIRQPRPATPSADSAHRPASQPRSFGRSARQGLAKLLLPIAALAGCASPAPSDYAAEQPRFALEQYFNGPVQGWGMVQDRSGKVLRRFSVSLIGQWEQRDGQWQGTLDEDFVWSDGERQKRIWRITRDAQGQYTGRADDVIGTAIGVAAGPALNWRYVLEVPVDGRKLAIDFDDWMFQIDGKAVLNRARMSKFGLHVGDVTVSFAK